jgi:hypothetical protein
MSVVDVDAVNERLNGLVTLLKAVGVDSSPDSDMKKVQGLGNLPGAQQLDDDQIEAIIRKLQKAQEEAPQIIAALEAHAEARSLTGSKSSQGGRSKSTPVPAPAPEPEEEDDDDSFDEDANYPMVGTGVSDDCSVMSDLTTPTVLNGVPVPEEEHYRDELPPMIIGGGHDAPAMVISAPKKKNLVSQSRGGPPNRRPVASSRGQGGGAAASRRNKYQNTMAKLGDEHPPRHPGNGEQSSRPKKTRPPSSGVRKKKSAPSGDLPNSRQNELAGDAGWNSFENKPKVPTKSPTMIDDDGFLVGGSFNPFGGDNFFKSSAGDLELGTSGGPRYSSNASASGLEGGSKPRRVVKKKVPEKQSMQSNFSSDRKARPSANGPAPGGRRRARRASLAM